MNHIVFKIAVTLVFAIVSWSTFAQESPIYTTYMFNETSFNPAYVGVPERLSVTALYRNQWLGVDGAPTTQTLSIHSPLKKENVALGLQVIRDAIGVSGRTEIQSMYAYRIGFSKKSKLSLGIQTGVRFYNEGYSQLYDETLDPGFNESYKTSDFVFGAGVYYHTERFYIGGSLPVIQTESNKQNHYYFTSGFVLDMGSQFKLKPSVMVKKAGNSPLALDLNTNLLIKEIIWFGVSYRVQESIGLLTRLQITQELSFGYAFDMPVKGISTYGNGSHELSLNYRFNKRSTTYKCPRYF